MPRDDAEEVALYSSERREKQRLSLTEESRIGDVTPSRCRSLEELNKAGKCIGMPRLCNILSNDAE